MFEQYLSTFESDLRSYCRMLTGTPWDADDLFQATMLKVLKAQDRLVQHPSPRAFLFRIASNAWIDECRKRKAEVGLPNNYESLAAESDDYSIDITDSLDHLVSSVPPFQASVVLLADVFAYNSSEIAGMLNNTEGAVKAALHRARKRLAGLAQQGGHPRVQQHAQENGNPRVQKHVQQNEKNNHASFIQQFLTAFRLQDPMVIAEAYRQLTQAGIHAERQLLQGRLYFMFRDPEGNAFTIMAEK